MSEIKTLEMPKWGPVSYTHSDAADERSSVDLGGRRIIKKKKHKDIHENTEIRSNCKVLT